MSVFFINVFAEKDRCSVGNGGCDQTCADSSTGVTCGCNAGYILTFSKKTCTGLWKS